MLLIMQIQFSVVSPDDIKLTWGHVYHAAHSVLRLAGLMKPSWCLFLNKITPEELANPTMNQ